jgi:hypothetical protein
MALINGEGIRKNSGKVSMWEVPPQVLFALAEHASAYRTKYPPSGNTPNWALGMQYSKVCDSINRHWAAFLAGEKHDAEVVDLGDKQYRALHIVAVLWGIMVLTWYTLNEDLYKEFDDRVWTNSNVKTTIGEPKE